MKWLIIKNDGEKYEIEAPYHSFSDGYCSFYNEDRHIVSYIMLRNVFLITRQPEIVTKLEGSNVG